MLNYFLETINKCWVDCKVITNNDDFHIQEFFWHFETTFAVFVPREGKIFRVYETFSAIMYPQVPRSSLFFAVAKIRNVIFVFGSADREGVRPVEGRSS